MVSKVSFSVFAFPLAYSWLSQKYGTPYPSCHLPGHNLWPWKLVTELYKIAKSCTPDFLLTLHTWTPVTSITSNSLSSSSNIPCQYFINTPHAPISCSYIIHATNAYASCLLLHFTSPQGIIPNHGQVIALQIVVHRDTLGMAEWVTNQAFKFWFPTPSKYDRGKDRDEVAPLVILGGEQKENVPQFKMCNNNSLINEDDDFVIKEDVVRHWRTSFLICLRGSMRKDESQKWNG